MQTQPPIWHNPYSGYSSAVGFPSQWQPWIHQAYGLHRGIRRPMVTLFPAIHDTISSGYSNGQFPEPRTH